MSQPFTAATAAVSAEGQEVVRALGVYRTGLSGSTNGLAETITKKVPKLAT